MYINLVYSTSLHLTNARVEVEIPDWNVFDVSLVLGVMEIARTHLADEGFLVTLCLAQDLGTILRYADKNSLQLHRSWTLDTDGGYVHPQTREQVPKVTLQNDCLWSSHTIHIYLIFQIALWCQVTDVIIGLFYHKNMPVPRYDRLAGQEVSPLLFPASRSCIAEGPLRASGDYTTVDGVLVQNAQKHSTGISIR